MNDDEIRSIVTKCYISVLKREPDECGLNTYINHIKNGLTVEKFCDILKSSDECKNINIEPKIISLNDYETSIKLKSNISNKITIICPTYNNVNYVSLFYNSYVSSIKNETRLIISINGNDTETEQFCIKNNIEYVTQKKQGMYSAINLAMQKVTDGYIMIINDDIYLDEMFFVEAEKLLSPDVVLISKSIQPIESGGTFKDFHNYGDSCENFDKKGFLEYCKKIKEDTLKFHTFGVVYIIHSSNLFVINGYDERFDPYGGGMADLMYRLYLSGIRNFLLMRNVLHYHFVRKCAIKHNLSRGSIDTEIFVNKWKKNFSDIDKIIKTGCENYGK